MCSKLSLPQLLPECAPNSVFYILELLALPHCIGCQIHRAESRGSFWDSKGNHIKRVRFIMLITIENCAYVLHRFAACFNQFLCE